MDELADRVALAGRDPEQLRQLLDRDEDREAEDESVDDRPREELGDEPQPEEAGDQQEAADEQDERGGVGQVVVPVERQASDGRGEQHRCRGRPGDDHVPARPEDRIGGERREQRVEPACGGSPARPAYAIISGTSSPQIVAPATTSKRRKRRS